MSKEVTVTYKIDPQTGKPHRPDFVTTEQNIEDHEKLFGLIIKDIKYSGAKSEPKRAEKGPIPQMGVEPDYKLLIKEKDTLIANLQEALGKMQEENDELRKQVKDGAKKKKIAVS